MTMPSLESQLNAYGQHLTELAAVGRLHDEPGPPRRRTARRSQVVLVAALVVFVAAVSVAVRSFAHTDPTTRPPAAADSEATEAQADPSSAVNPYRSPQPLLMLPDDQRQAWVKMWQAKADCMHAHGVPSFPDAPATFGDGRTPAPLAAGPDGSDLDPASPAFQQADAACPYDYSGLNQSEFDQAWDNWRAAGAPTG